jgi:phage I-like protein
MGEQQATLSILVDGDNPPTRVRLLKKGINEAEGYPPFLFDDIAAEAVMSAYRKHGVDKMIDLEHLSLDQRNPNYDPDARAWYELSVSEGDLFLENIRWLEDGERRLRTKTQRYLSPVFPYDKSGRPTRIKNVALTALPASHDAVPLVAASEGVAVMADTSYTSFETVDAIGQALGLPKGAEPGEVLAEVSAFLKAWQSITDPEKADKTEGELPQPPPEVVAASESVLRLTGMATLNEAVEQVEIWRKSHAVLTEAQEKLAKERSALEGQERLQLVAKLVAIGSEIPATAWSDHKATTPCARLASEPIAELRNRVARMIEVRGTTKATVAPTKAVSALTEREIAICKEANCDPQTFLRLRDRRVSEVK